MDQKIFAGHVSLAPEAIEASGQSKMQPKALLERSHTEKVDLSFFALLALLVQTSSSIFLEECQ
jgi:hypothetical protein